MVLSAGAVVALKNGILAHINEQLAVFISALLIGLFGNSYGRLTGSPALIVILNAVYMIGAWVRAACFLSVGTTTN